MQARRACYFILELGLSEDDLAVLPASLRCCAVLFVIRVILKKYCRCGADVESESNECCHRRMEVWPIGMYGLTGVANCPILRQTAGRYADALHTSEELRSVSMRFQILAH